MSFFVSPPATRGEAKELADVDLEFHQLERRYEALRTRQVARERRLLASLAEIGQQTPIVVVAGEAGRYVVIDGYKRVRALERLGHDTVRATSWDLVEADALLLERLLRAGDGDSPLEQGWFLRELRSRFGLSAEELARRFDRSPSWVSGRLGLVAELPDEIQALVQSGAIVAHAAIKYLVPFARACRADCLVAVGTALAAWARAAPRTDPSVRNYRTGLLPRVVTRKRWLGQG